jgi:hypothetical protein
MKGSNWIGTAMVALAFVLITIWPGPKYWYIGTAFFAAFMVWLALKTWK